MTNEKNDILTIPESDQGYYRHPTVFDNRVIFVSEDDLWEVSINGGYARRLTSSPGIASNPHFSPDGTQLAFTSTEEGAPEVFVMAAKGGPTQQLTFNGAQSSVVGWSQDGKNVLFRSNYREAFARDYVIYSVPANGGETQTLPFGTAHNISYEPGNKPGRVLARHTDDLARWKRYKGGTAGVLWIDTKGDGSWNRLLPEITSGLCRPMWIGDRIYFLSDFEGYGNLYSCTPDGQELRRHTDHVGFYVRFPSTDGKTIVYTAGGDLYRFDVASDTNTKIDVDYASPRTAMKRKFVDADMYLDDFSLHPRGHSLVINTRGKIFNFGNWEGAVRQNGEEQGVRYRLSRYLNDGARIVTVSDQTGEERFEIHRADGSAAAKIVDYKGAEIGRPVDICMSPVADELVFANHRQELVHLNLADGTARVLDRSDHNRITGLAYSPDGRWIAYGFSNGQSTSIIKIADLTTGECFDVTNGEFQDVNPYFDPAGRYLYFLSYRQFDPVFDQMFFELSFPRGMVPCVVTLRADVESPFIQKPRSLDGDDEDEDDEKDDEDTEDTEESTDDSEVSGKDAKEEKSKDKEKDDQKSKDDKPKPVEIDFDGIESRVETFPVAEGSYGDIAAIDDTVFWTVYPISGSLDSHDMDAEQSGGGTLKAFSLKSLKEKVFARETSGFEIGSDRKTIALLGINGIQVVSASGGGPAAGGDMDDDGGDETPSRQSGWINLARVSVCVDPRQEWRQMLRESWRLMRDHFWREDMSGVDWNEVWSRYKTLISRVLTRAEFSDLVWTMQGELGTSHAYEIGGDYAFSPQYRPGFLGAEVEWNPDWTRPVAEDSEDSESNQENQQTDTGAYKITRIIRGDSWNASETSPLTRPGLRIQEGDHIVAINGRRTSAKVSIEERLIHQAGREVELVIAHQTNSDNNSEDATEESQELETCTVKTLLSETPARYREWVLNNRKVVHEASNGQLGYVHIPDMGPLGYAEFHRSYLSENTKKGLVVDVRHNGGGFVSQLILEKLARRNLGYGLQRWSQPIPYPEESVQGPLVCLTNENAGSDGDIFSHCFKLMNLGPLLGKRTWGGVVGIQPSHALVDGSITTQPEFSFWFNDVGFNIENYGTEPDIEVELPPQAENDPQLEAALKLALKMLDESKPALPDFAPYPLLRPPAELPPRGIIDPKKSR